MELLDKKYVFEITDTEVEFLIKCMNAAASDPYGLIHDVNGVLPDVFAVLHNNFIAVRQGEI